jgi:hypothetical protein
MKVHSSDLDPDELRHLLADRIAQDQAHEFSLVFRQTAGGDCRRCVAPQLAGSPAAAHRLVVVAGRGCVCLRSHVAATEVPIHARYGAEALASTMRNSGSSYGCSSRKPGFYRSNALPSRLNHDLLLEIFFDRLIPPVNRPHRRQEVHACRQPFADQRPGKRGGVSRGGNGRKNDDGGIAACTFHLTLVVVLVIETRYSATGLH